jgi:hypothetical protein
MTILFTAPSILLLKIVLFAMSKYSSIKTFSTLHFLNTLNFFVQAGFKRAIGNFKGTKTFIFGWDNCERMNPCLRNIMKYALSRCQLKNSGLIILSFMVYLLL